MVTMPEMNMYRSYGVARGGRKTKTSITCRRISSRRAHTRQGDKRATRRERAAAMTSLAAKGPGSSPFVKVSRNATDTSTPIWTTDIATAATTERGIGRATATGASLVMDSQPLGNPTEPRPCSVYVAACRAATKPFQTCDDRRGNHPTSGAWWRPSTGTAWRSTSCAYALHRGERTGRQASMVSPDAAGLASVGFAQGIAGSTSVMQRAIMLQLKPIGRVARWESQ